MAAPAQAELRLGGWRWSEQPVEGNRQPEPDESGSLTLHVWNDADAPVPALTGTLRVLAPATGVTVAVGSSSWPALAPTGNEGEAAWSLTPFSLQLEPTLACAETLALQLELTPSGQPPVLIDFELGLGLPDATLGPAVPFGYVDGDSCTFAWDGQYVGVAYSQPPRFLRLDAEGNIVDWPPVDLSHDWWGLHGPVSMALGDNGWLVVSAAGGAAQLVTSLIKPDGTLDSYRIAIPQEHPLEVVAGAPSLAWDGEGFGVLVQARDVVGVDSFYDRLTYIHLDANGVPDSEPVVHELGFPLARFQPHPLEWNGREFGAIAWGNLVPARFLRLDRTGAFLAEPKPLPWTAGVAQPSLQWTGSGYAALTPSSGTVQGPQIMGLHPDGSVRWGPFLVDAEWYDTSNFLQSGASPGDRTDLVWNGRVLLASLSYGTSLIDASFAVFQDLYAFTEDGQRFQEAISIPDDMSLGPWSGTPRGTGTWVPETGEFLIPSARGDDTAEVGDGEGTLVVQRVVVDTACPAGEPPREVSAPGSGSPLLLTSERFRQCPTCDDMRRIVAHVEDLGAEANAYNRITIAKALSPGSRRTPQVWTLGCGLVPGESPGIDGDGPNRLRINVDESDWVPFNGARKLFTFSISASNEWGAGSWGVGDDGNERALQACFASP